MFPTSQQPVIGQHHGSIDDKSLTRTESKSGQVDKEQKQQALQSRLYFILNKLQDMTQEIPPNYQQRMPSELLSGLANTLLHNTIFEIVKGLKEIQDATEKHLYQSRVTLLEKQRVERQLAKQQNLSKPANHYKDLIHRQKKELKSFDMKIVMNMDQKVSDQQVMLEKAGVPGFYVTNNPPEIRLQMYILDFILKLSEMPLPPVAWE